MQARIYKPTKTAMQSGKARTKKWLLEFEHDGSRNIDNIMYWTSSEDTCQEIMIYFSNKELAENFAIKNKIPYEIFDPELKKITTQSYADNFK